MIGGNINQRYKTMICRHWEQSSNFRCLKESYLLYTAGQCQMGTRCHFAHGKEELRQASDPIPLTGNGLIGDSKLKSGSVGFGYGMPYSNYKTVKCKYYDQGACKYGENCSFAHGDGEIRNFQDNPTAAYSMPPYSGYVQPQTPMYNPMIMSEMNAKIMQMQLQYLIYSLSQYKKEDLISQNLKTAIDLLNANNISACVQILNDIMYNPNATLEEKEAYKTFLAEAQNVGNQVLQTYLNPATTQMNPNK